jgi:uncharacterized membrane-anchored protein
LLSGLICVAATAAPAPGQDARGILDTPDQAYADAMRQSTGAPARADLGEQASVRLDGGLVLVPRDAAAHLLTVNDRPVPKDFVALLLGSEGMDAPGIVRFVPAGYIESNEALAWSADDILDSLRDTVEKANPARVAQNLEEREARRWISPPHYTAESHLLTWAALIVPKGAPRETDGEITFHGLAFGRDGYIEITVVTSVQQADSVRRMVGTFLSGITFARGKSFADAGPGDPRAPGGLAAAMGIDALHKARDTGSFWSSDRIIPAAGGLVAAIGAISLLLYVQRQLRREALRT